MGRTIAILALTMAIVGCSSRGAPDRPDRERHLITAQEIDELNLSTAYDVVRHLRPEFLRSRGTMSLRNTSGEFAVVYINGMRAGGLDQLNAIRANDVDTIRYISASDATTRWGTGHTGGVIEVTVKS
jgi:hypothetical protein